MAKFHPRPLRKRMHWAKHRSKTALPGAPSLLGLASATSISHLLLLPVSQGLCSQHTSSPFPFEPLFPSFPPYTTLKYLFFFIPPKSKIINQLQKRKNVPPSGPAFQPELALTHPSYLLPTVSSEGRGLKTGHEGQREAGQTFSKPSSQNGFLQIWTTSSASLCLLNF